MHIGEEGDGGNEAAAFPGREAVDPLSPVGRCDVPKVGPLTKGGPHEGPEIGHGVIAIAQSPKEE